MCLKSLPSLSLLEREYLPETPGIYFATAIERVFYVGRSHNLRERWRNHHRCAELELIAEIRLYWLVAPVGFLEHLEAAMIQLFNPPLNRYRPVVLPLHPSQAIPVVPLEAKVRDRYPDASDAQIREMMRLFSGSTFVSIERESMRL